jgi:hypothetical protein
MPLKPRRLRSVRRWIFAYFFLLLFEGALRKWVFAGVPLISLPFSVARDPIAVIIWILAWRAGVLSNNLRRASWLGLGAFSVLGTLQIFANSGLNFWIVLYGLRTYWLHVPLVFIMAEVLGQDDLQQIGRWLLALAGPMAALMVAQFFAPPDSFLNRGMLEGVGQIGSALGRIRPAGTFSYNTGTGNFNLLVAAFLIYSSVNGRWVSPWMRWTAAVAVVVTLPISGSRGFVLTVAELLAFALIGGNFNGRLLRVTLGTIAVGGAIFFLLTFSGFFQEGLETFTTRWDQAIASTTTGSFSEAIVMRFFGEFLDAFRALGEAPIFGHGIGLGSNFGSALTFGSLGFALAEGEWPRTVLEMGPIAGAVWLGLRCALGFYLLGRSWVFLRRGRVLAWLLFGTECTTFFNGSLAQPTSLGFLIFTTGLCLAAIKSAERGESIPARAPNGPIRRIELRAIREVRRRYPAAVVESGI